MNMVSTTSYILYSHWITMSTMLWAEKRTQKILLHTNFWSKGCLLNIHVTKHSPVTDNTLHKHKGI